MKLIRALLIIALSIALANCGSKSYDPSDSLAPQEKDKLVSTIIRYAIKPPENVSGDERFQKQYDEYYQKQGRSFRLERYHRDGNTEYFLVSQPAPSLTEKRNATGGLLEMNDGKLTRYEEVFRTWKLVPDTLKRRSYMLFDKMVSGESLERFRTKFTAPEEYIEFPDDNTFYDANERAWKIKN
ncbi:hypothetical protein WBG78_02520 [Chryseolinea sp. T2]|uniref:hypothetical protein n=1 Tax=Chryseolinea sp. T2 TaxID=3129255 RepID=UPI003076F62C